MKKILLFLSLFLLIIPIYGNAIVSPTNEFYINDYANILSSETEEYILQRSLALHAADGTQIVVVTVPNLEGMSLEKYANDLFNSFGIGDKEKNNGLLLLLALEERKFRVEVGDGLGGILPDGKTGRFQDNYIIPYLREDKWDEGIRNGYDAFYTEIVEQNNLDVDYNKPVSYYVDGEGYSLEGDAFPLYIVGGAFILAAITGTTVNLSPKKKKAKLVVTYMAIWFLLLLLAYVLCSDLILGLILYFVFFWFFAFGNGRYGVGGFSGGHSSGGSSRGFSGGGGRSSGGGSSRSF